jgi:hypothetical protein
MRLCYDFGQPRLLDCPPRRESRALMDRSVASDLTNQTFSSVADAAPRGRHDFEWAFRVPVLGLRCKIASRFPGRAPAGVALGVLAFTAVALVIPAVLALAATAGPMPSWLLSPADVAFGGTMAGLTILNMWYQQRPRSHDLSRTEGAPTDRATVLLAHEPFQTHEFQVGKPGKPWVNLSVTSSSHSPLGLGMAFLVLALALLCAAAGLVGLGALISASPASVAVNALIASIWTAACGVFTMIRIEQLERNVPRPPPESPVSTARIRNTPSVPPDPPPEE